MVSTEPTTLIFRGNSNEPVKLLKGGTTSVLLSSLQSVGYFFGFNFSLVYIHSYMCN
jgi:hypothetical protein